MNGDEPDPQLLEERIFALLSDVISAGDTDRVEWQPVSLAEIRAELERIRGNPRPTWAVPAGFTVDQSIPVDVIQLPWTSEYIYVLPPADHPWLP